VPGRNLTFTKEMMSLKDFVGQGLVVAQSITAGLSIPACIYGPDKPGVQIVFVVCCHKSLDRSRTTIFACPM